MRDVYPQAAKTNQSALIDSWMIVWSMRMQLEICPLLFENMRMPDGISRERFDKQNDIPLSLLPPDERPSQKGTDRFGVNIGRDCTLRKWISSIHGLVWLRNRSVSAPFPPSGRVERLFG
jgi:hypothetical protein